MKERMLYLDSYALTIYVTGTHLFRCMQD
jgi:hypothetical protein